MESILSWLDLNSNIVTTVATITLAFTSIVLAYFNRRLVTQAKKEHGANIFLQLLEKREEVYFALEEKFKSEFVWNKGENSIFSQTVLRDTLEETLIYDTNDVENFFNLLEKAKRYFPNYNKQLSCSEALIRSYCQLLRSGEFYLAEEYRKARENQQNMDKRKAAYELKEKEFNEQEKELKNKIITDRFSLNLLIKDITFKKK